MTKAIIHNVETNEIIERPLTPDEIEVREKHLAQYQKEVTEKINRDEAKKALLEKLGITEDEAKLLLS